MRRVSLPRENGHECAQLLDDMDKERRRSALSDTKIRFTFADLRDDLEVDRGTSGDTTGPPTNNESAFRGQCKESPRRSTRLDDLDRKRAGAVNSPIEDGNLTLRPPAQGRRKLDREHRSAIQRQPWRSASNSRYCSISPSRSKAKRARCHGGDAASPTIVRDSATEARSMC